MFVEASELLNAEEWLLRLDYSASKSSDSPSIRKLQKSRLDLVTKILVKILPDVEAIRFTTPTRERPDPEVEFQTPYGWVPLDSLVMDIAR